VFQPDPSVATVIASRRSSAVISRRVTIRRSTVRRPPPEVRRGGGPHRGARRRLHRDIVAENLADEVVDLGIRLRNATPSARGSRSSERAQTREALEIERELARVTADVECSRES